MTSKEATHLYRLQQWGEAVKDCKSSGKTVGAIRTLLSTVAARQNKRAMLEVVE